MAEAAMATGAPTPEELAGMATERSALYRLLAAVFRDELTEEQLKQILNLEFLDKIANTGLDTAPLASLAAVEDLQNKLALEYSSLFVGPGKHVAPYESVHLGGDGGTLWGPQTSVVKRFIEQSGFDYDEDYRDLPDHISVELEFMAQLTEIEAKFWKCEDTDKALNCIKFQKEFMEKHLGLWVETFHHKIEELAEYPFYPQLAKLTQTFVAEEIRELENFVS